MTCRVRAAGRPFSGLLALERGSVDGAAKRSGVIARDDREIGAGWGRATFGLTRRVTQAEKC